MDAIERPTFESDAASELYQYVERHGTATRERVREAIRLPPAEFDETLDQLLSKGYLQERGGKLSLALDIGAVESHTTGTETYVIRPSRPADFDGLVDLIRDVSAGGTYVIAESIAEQLLYEDAITRHNTVESRVFFVATMDEEIVGWCHLDLPQVETQRGTAQLTVGVAHDARGQGIGSQLLERGTDWARANGYRKLYNSVPLRSERALSFLDDHGWHTEGIRKDHYTIDGDLVDEVMMAYQIE
ncbi:GNAT family N-acetyltransferase [Haloarcula sp. GH36]|uniref:GNAT family N-acetyltransferase n=1 Tax=Haloarcula montana TaxID=3111776 RepID=UPI002D7A388D|nr:GNAT family N-acetyltransferase [Haloarcula sp. GH36]